MHDVQPIDTAAGKVLNRLTKGLDYPEERRFEAAKGGQGVLVDRVGSDLYCVCHYRDDSEGLTIECEMLFWRSSSGWKPVKFRRSYAEERIQLLWFDKGEVTLWDPPLYRMIKRFCDLWLQSIGREQCL